jgi:predicted DNA-binding transcriptional regulator AlpA
MLAVSPATVRDWRKAGTFAPALKLSRAVRWRPEDIEAWLVKRRERVSLHKQAGLQSDTGVLHVEDK